MTRVFLICFPLLFFLLACDQKHQRADAPEGMVWIPGGEFVMGSDDVTAYEHERPAHRVRVDGFWMDATEVTNKAFKEFIDATGYVTVAERKPEWEELKGQLPAGTPKPADSVLVAGSLVFAPPGETVMLNDYSQWWRWTEGANWKHPEGPASNIDTRWDHPVVHVAFEDALAYCAWAKKRLPTEAEWEFAVRGGRENFAAAAPERVNGKPVANYFQGSFPNTNLDEDGFRDTSPVKSFPAGGYGLYDMIGNVWEWTSDFYDVKYYRSFSPEEIADNPKGPSSSNDPLEPGIKKYVTKGGSFLCASNYCSNYRASARQGTAYDTGLSHIGFRCVKSD